jgi:anaerobic selenocysteine-containing dehydrogenase
VASRRALLATPTRKFQFFALGPRREILAGPEVVPVAPAADADFPFVLGTYRPATRPVGGGRNQAWLMERAPAHLPGPGWQAWIELHPDDARALGIAEGDPVWVESEKGRLRLTARVHAGRLPGVVHMPLPGDARHHPNVLIADAPDPTRGFGLLTTTRVRVRRA